MITSVAIQESSDYPGYYRIAVLSLPASTLGVGGHGGGCWKQFKNPCEPMALNISSSTRSPTRLTGIASYGNTARAKDAIFSPEDWTSDWKLQDKKDAKGRGEAQKREEELRLRREETEKHRGRKSSRRRSRLPF
jgi:hypothetical protein